jgi:hypothetical protein
MISTYVYGEKGKHYLTYSAKTNRYLTVDETSRRGQQHSHYPTDDGEHSHMAIRVVENKLFNCGSAWIRPLALHRGSPVSHPSKIFSA